MSIFHGVGAAMVTPFSADGSVNFAVIDDYVEKLISGGVSALLPLGTTGEPATLDSGEYKAVAQAVISRAKHRVPIIVGSGSNSTKTAVQKTELIKSLGGDGVLCVTPYYNKCTQRGAIEHYKAIAAVGLPVIVYNVPARTGFNLAPDTLAELAAVKNIVGIKEASSDIFHVQSVARVCAETELDFYSGDDELILVDYALGASGVISVAVNAAIKQTAELCALCEQGKFEEARKAQFKLSRFYAALFCEVNPIPVKKAMQLVGIDVGAPRLPLTELEPDHTLKLSSLMHEVGLL